MTPGDHIPIASVPNLRDLGGWATKDGSTVRRGLLYRSTALNKLEEADMETFAQLGVRSVYDLRTEAERRAQPDRLPDGVAYMVCDVLADSSDAAPAELMELLSDPAAAARLLGDGKAEALFERGYRQIVSLPSALAGYRQLFTDVSEPQRRPALLHCTTGKDRTGWAAAVLLAFLGVAQDDVMEDYLLTNDALLPALQPLLDGFASIGGHAELLRPVLGVQASYLDAAFDEMRQRFGSVEGYFAEGLGVEAETQTVLRAALIGERAV